MATGSRRSPGRPTSLTPELQDAIVALVKSGNDVKTACAVVGVGRTTYYRWMARGASDDPADAAYRVFAAEVEQARAIAEAALVRSLADVSRLNWRVALERLERMYPHKWGPPVRARDGGVIRLPPRRSIL
jgi:transposase-like protein